MLNNFSVLSFDPDWIMLKDLKDSYPLYATTFLRPFPDIVFRFFTLQEIEHIARDAGFGGRSIVPSSDNNNNNNNKYDNSDSNRRRLLNVKRKGPVYAVLTASK